MSSYLSSTIEDMSLRRIASIVILSFVFVISSDLIMGYILGNIYNSSYFTFSLLFDAVGYDAALPYIAPFSSLFYPFFGMLILDGIVKIIVIGFLIASVIELLSSIDFKRQFNLFAAHRRASHIIVCGYSNFTDRLIKDLSAKKKKFTIIEKNQANADMLKSLGHIVVEGDFKNELYLNDASIQSASGVVFGSDNDFDNIVGVITVKKIAPKVRTIIRINEESSVTKMLRAGADLCIIPEILVGIDLGNNIVAKLRGK
ncbi:MAG: NAD-binding protein [Candidatus Marsarchaeota archaeon]|nr:NAD-binding protein [Candidatus Marsarchaeota archaeon]